MKRIILPILFFSSLIALFMPDVVSGQTQCSVGGITITCSDNQVCGQENTPSDSGPVPSPICVNPTSAPPNVYIPGNTNTGGGLNGTGGGNELNGSGGGALNGTGGGNQPNCSNGICISPPSVLPGNVCTLINNVMHAIMVDIIPPLAALMVVYSAFLFLTSGGNEETVKKAKNALLYTIIGIAVVLVSTGIIYVIEDLLNVSHSVSICSTS